MQRHIQHVVLYTVDTLANKRDHTHSRYSYLTTCVARTSTDML